MSMATKRTKFDKAQRQADRLEKKADTSTEQTPKKGQPRGFALRDQPREDFALRKTRPA
jgi:hypothetical protein